MIPTQQSQDVVALDQSLELLARPVRRQAAQASHPARTLPSSPRSALPPRALTCGQLGGSRPQVTPSHHLLHRGLHDLRRPGRSAARGLREFGKRQKLRWGNDFPFVEVSRHKEEWARVCQVASVASHSLRPAGQAPLSVGFSRRAHWRRCIQGIFPTQGLSPHLITSPALAGGLLTTSTTWGAHREET